MSKLVLKTKNDLQRLDVPVAVIAALLFLRALLYLLQGA